MPVEVRYYDYDGDGTWLRLVNLEPDPRDEPEDESVVDVCVKNDLDESSIAVRLTADDVKRLITDLQSTLPKTVAGSIDTPIVTTINPSWS